MSKKIVLFFLSIMLLTVIFSGCKTRKGCGCGNNLNYYKPRKFKS